MAEQGQKGPYRAFWDNGPVLRAFLEAIRIHSPDVMTSLRDAVDPALALAVDESHFLDAFDEWISLNHRCGTLAGLLGEARRVLDGREARIEAPGRDDQVRECGEGRLRVGNCPARQYLIALFSDCRREKRPHCQGVALLAGDGGGCEDYARLDDAARRCLAANGTRCHATDDLDYLAPAEEPPDSGDESDAGDGRPGGDGPDAEAGDEAGRLLAAVWEWASRHHLVAERDALRRSAAEFGDDPLLPEMAYHRRFLMVVYQTLWAWASSAEQRGRLGWAIESREGVGFDDAALGVFHGQGDHVAAGPVSEEGDFICRHGNLERYEILFRPEKWDPFRESQGEAAARITAAFRGHLDRVFAGQHEALKKSEDVVPSRRSLETWHAKWLVQHQVLGWRSVKIGDEDPLYAGREAKEISFLIGREIRKAADLLLGPRYGAWLVPFKVGRPGSGEDGQGE